MIDRTDLLVSMLRVTARRMRENASGEVHADTDIDARAMREVEGERDWRDLQNSGNRYADR